MHSRGTFLENIINGIIKKWKPEQPQVPNVYWERVLSHVSSYRDVNRSLQQEILEEIAFSLKKSESHLKEALYECQYWKERCISAEDQIEKRNYYNKYKNAYQKAKELKWKYMVQREALGLIWTEDMENQYALPDFKFEKQK